MLHNLTQIKRAVSAKGGHWFDSDTLRFFGSRISSTVYPVADGAYFVSSEHTGFRREGRAYSVRLCSDAGEIDTVGEFLAYPTLARAHTAAKAYQRSHEAVLCAS